MDLSSLSVHGRSTTSTAWVTNPIRRLLWWLVAPYFRGAGNEIAAELAAQRATLLENMEGPLRATLLENMEGSLRAILASELGGMRKDTRAIAFRLSGIEEEAANAEQMRTQLAEWLGKVQEQVEAQAQLVERMDAAARETPIRPGQHIVVGDSGLVLVQTAGGASMLVRPQDHIGRIVAGGGEWEPHVREAIERAAHADGIAIDAGAYIGIHTVTMARLFKTVHAFEPQRGIYQLLCGNLALNGCTNVIAHDVALYDRAGSVRLAPQERQEIPTPLKNGQPDYQHIANAAALSFDFVTDGSDVRAAALDDFALTNVRLIKVDTQGADLRVLQGALGTIRQFRPTVLFEWEHDLGLQHGATLDKYFDFFADLNYEVTMTQNTTPGRQADYIAIPR